ncbi:MAG: 30S ribosomal protein S17 [Nanoarchaeota archaeon]|nr:30S ribosomal protein S17 [Nanoarchaeota archaeon]
MRNIGIPGINPPSDTCNDKYCPFHGKISIRGRLFEGVVVSDKPTRTVVVKWERRVYFPKYERFEKRFTKVNAHAPKCLHIKKDDKVIIGECRPLSKTKKFVVLAKVGENERT